MKQKNQQKRKKKRSRAVNSSGDGTSGGNKKDLEEEEKNGEGNKDIKKEKEEKTVIESLMEAFCSVSLEEAAAAYTEAGGDLNKAAEILSDLVETGDDPSTSSVSSGSSAYGAGSSSCCSDDLLRDRWVKGSKQSRVIAATGMVSSVIGKDYMRPNPVKKEVPLVEKSKEFNRNGKKAEDREKAEQFLNSLLGDDCELSMAVVRDVLCQCGYDVEMALNVLLDMSSSSTDDSLSGRCYRNALCYKECRGLRIGVRDNLAQTSSDCITSESELKNSFRCIDYNQRDYAKALMSSEDTFATSEGSSYEVGLPQKVLESLFQSPQSIKGEPKKMNWRNVAKKMQSLGMDTSSSSGEEFQPDICAKDDGYHELRKGANDQWNMTNSYYQRAAEAYSKGGRAHAAYLSDKGRTAAKSAQRADEMASRNIFIARNKGIENVITIDFHGQHVKQAMKLLKLHLLFGSYVPSIQTLRVITGCGSHGFGKSKVKQSVMKLLEREGIGYSEENRGTLLIKVGGCNKEFSFLNTDSDSE